MADLSLPDVIDPKYWERSVTKVAPAVDKASKAGDSINEVFKAFNKLKDDLKLLDTSDVEPKETLKHKEKIDADVIKPLKSLQALVAKLESEANKALPEAKKAGKESAVKAITTAVKVFKGDIESTIDEANEATKQLAKGVVGGGAGGVDKKKAEALKKQIERLNVMAKKAIRELRAGKVRKVPFVLAQHKIKEPYKKGKPWGKKSLVHLHPKAGNASKNILAKLIELPSPVWAIGEATCEDRKKIIFNCTLTPAANIKQLKDALMFQMNYAPPMKVMKGNKVEGDEAADGEDSGEAIGDVEDLEDDVPETAAAGTAGTTKSADPTTATSKATDGDDADDKKDAALEQRKKKVKDRFAQSAAAIQAAILVNDDKAKDIKTWAVKLAAETKDGGDVDAAEKLIKKIEDRLAGKTVAKDEDEEQASSSSGGVGGAGASAPNPALEAALRELGTARSRAADGASRVAELIRKAYEGDPQYKKATEGATKVDEAGKKLLSTKIEASVASQLKGADAKKRTDLANQLKNYREAIAKHDLLPDIDKSPFDPSLSVIAPYLTSLQNVEQLLRAAA
jgi:hypothetical protein